MNDIKQKVLKKLAKKYPNFKMIKPNDKDSVTVEAMDMVIQLKDDEIKKLKDMLIEKGFDWELEDFTLKKSIGLIEDITQKERQKTAKEIFSKIKKIMEAKENDTWAKQMYEIDELKKELGVK